MLFNCQSAAILKNERILYEGFLADKLSLNRLMSLKFRFAIASDLHIAVPQTIGNHPKRFHLVEISIPALETVLQHLETLDLDFLLLPGDLTQDGEAENHAWLQERLESLPFPVYVVPGNHDIPSLLPTEYSIGLKAFPYYYRRCGYREPDQLYYTCEPLPGVQLIALNSNSFDTGGRQVGRLDKAQFNWLKRLLPTVQDKLVLVMIHHNVVEHLPEQSRHPLSRRYMLKNAPLLRQLLREFGVKLVFSGHLHVQDLAYADGVYDLTTGSLVSYPHPYRLIEVQASQEGQTELKIESYHVQAVPGWKNLQHVSREWMGERSFPFIVKLLTGSPLNLTPEEAEHLAPQLRYFWADIAAGDAIFDFPEFPPRIRQYFERFSATTPEGTPQTLDNRATLVL